MRLGTQGCLISSCRQDEQFKQDECKTTQWVVLAIKWRTFLDIIGIRYMYKRERVL